jgi:hypothetical protein
VPVIYDAQGFCHAGRFLISLRLRGIAVWACACLGSHQSGFLAESGEVTILGAAGLRASADPIKLLL